MEPDGHLIPGADFGTFRVLDLDALDAFLGFRLVCGILTYDAYLFSWTSYSYASSWS